MGLTPVLEMNCLATTQIADPSFYQQLVTFVNAKRRGVCLNQSDIRNSPIRTQSDKGQEVLVFSDDLLGHTNLTSVFLWRWICEWSTNINSVLC